MKLVRIGERGKEKPGLLLDDGTRVDVSSFGTDYDEEFFGGNGVESLRRWADKNAAVLPRVEPSVRLGTADLPSEQDCLHRIELQGSRGRNEAGSSQGAGDFLQGYELARQVRTMR